MENTIELSPIDQLHTTQGFICVHLFFPLHATSRNAVVAKLKDSLTAIAAVNPVLKARLRPHPARLGRKQAVFSDSSGIDFKNLTHDLETYSDLQKRQFRVTPEQDPKFFPVKWPRPDSEELQHMSTMLVQANFVQGGLVLSFAFNHGVYDGQSCGSVIELLAKYYGGVDLGPLAAEMQIVRVSASCTMPLEDALALNGGPLWTSGEEIRNDRPSATPETMIRVYQISSTALLQLKSDVTQALANHPACQWISTLDAAIALIWICVMHARVEFLDPQKLLEFILIINIRRHMRPPLPEGYLGNVCGIAYISRPLPPKPTRTKDLGDVAAAIRLAITNAAVDHDKKTRMTTALSEAEEDLGRIGYTLQQDPPEKFVVTSWASNRVGNVDFGGELGRPDDISLGLGPPQTGVCVIPPKDRKGNLRFELRLERSAVAKLENDGFWSSIVERIDAPEWPL